MNEYLDMICGMVCLDYGACRLGGRCWRWQDLVFWAHLVLIGSAVAIVAQREDVPMEAVLFRLGVAGYFCAQTWRIWQMQRRMKRRVNVV